jgi:putative transcriptional regulator
MEKAENLQADNPSIKIACFVGHSGWSPGQLEHELNEDAWIVSALDKELFARLEDKQVVWKNVVGSVSDELRFLADAPEDPELN